MSAHKHNKKLQKHKKHALIGLSLAALASAIAELLGRIAVEHGPKLFT